MKKLLVIPFLAALAFAACKKKENTVSTLVTYSEPTITINGSQYYSIPVGGSLPTISATAYDSFYKQAYDVVIDQSTLDNTKAGLNIVYIKAKNKYGMIGTSAVYVAVTNISPTINLAGKYVRTSNNDTVNVTRLATGLYRTDNVGGVLPSSPAFIVPAYFVQTRLDMIDLPFQETPLGTMEGINDSLYVVASDTFYQYTISGNSSFGSALRVFQKL